MARTYYHTSSTGSSSTSLTSYQDKATLTFTPTSGKTYAIFMSALITNNNTADKTWINIYDDTNAATLYEASIEPHDSTDLFSVTGVGIFTAASGSSHTFKVQYYTDSGGTASIQDVYLTALELVDTDTVSSTTGTFVVTGGAGGIDGDDEYDTMNQITVDAGSYLIVGCCTYTHSATGAAAVNRARILIWDDTNNTAYGYSAASYVKETSQYNPYWYVMAVAPGSSTNYDLRAGVDYNISITTRYRTILALDRTANRQTYSAHAENIQNSTSLSDTVADSITVSLDNSGNNLILASWWGAHEDTATSWFSNIQLNGTDIYTSDIAVEPNDGDGSPSFDGDDASNWCCGFAGVQNMSSGSNTVRVVWYTENTGDTAAIARVNVSGFDLDSALGFSWYVKNSGSWKAAENFYVKHSGTWKAATGLYVKSGGAWKSLLNEPTFTGENVDAASSEYTNVFPNPPPPPPPPPPQNISCLDGNSLILMADWSLKAIREIVAGDMVMTMTGEGGRVVSIETPKLTHHRNMMLLTSPDGRKLRISDDHDLWFKDNDIEQWGTYNYEWWLHEAENTNEVECPAEKLSRDRSYTFAVDSGWYKTKPEFETENDPNETIYGITLDKGAGYIANGFVVITAGCTSEEVANFKWNGILKD